MANEKQIIEMLLTKAMRGVWQLHDYSKVTDPTIDGTYEKAKATAGQIDKAINLVRETS